MDFACLPNLVIKLAERVTGGHPGGLCFDVDVDGSEIGGVENGEGGLGRVGEAVVVVAPASDLQVYPGALGAGYDRWDLRLLGRFEDHGWFGSGGSVQAAVSDVEC